MKRRSVTKTTPKPTFPVAASLRLLPKRIVKGTFVAAIGLVGAFVDGGHSPLLAQQAETIYWSKPEFTIPFHVDNDGSQPAAVLLEISTDDGLSWAPYARDGVKARQFRFTSQGDGLYLFRIKTIDNFGQSFDPGAEPLRVLVDTSSPELSLEIDTDEVGRLIANFQIMESNPRIDSIRLEFQTEHSGGWTAVRFDTNRQSSNELVGRGFLDVPTAARQLVVRLVAKDAAGNESEVTRLPQLPRTASALSGMTLASGRNAPPNSQKGMQSPPPFANPPLSSARFGSSLQPTIDAPQVPTSEIVGNIQVGPKNESLSLNTDRSVTQQEVQRYRFQPITNESLLSTDRSRNSDRSNNSAVVTKPFIAQEPDTAPLLLSNSSASQTPSRNVGKTNSDPVAPSLQGNTRSVDQRPYYSNSKAFSLDYSVDQNRSSQINSIELWGTSNKGQTWELWGTDPDGTSPFDISVEEEGLFGFRMVLVGVNGMTANRPRNGDNADAWIFVDTQIPSARLITAMYGRGTESGSLIIEFNAQDDQFSDRPIKLSYSETMSGPWTTIVSGYENSGRFVWTADPNLPPRVYLQIEAFDQAGNVGVHRLDLPVDIEGLAPRGKIQGFRPIRQ